MAITELTAKSILRKSSRVESWFLARYGMNLYRGCTHQCAYCDGRAEGYYVEGDFGTDIGVKVNAVDILRRELDPARKRSPLKRGYVVVGGGVNDSYQPLESRYCLTRRVLELLEQHPFPVHVLTKSVLVERDMDVLARINAKTRAVVSFSFSSTSDETSGIFEPGASLPSQRLEAIRRFKQQGIACGMYLMPLVPFVTDLPAVLERTVRDASEAGVDFIVYGGMTLKDGRQREHFDRVLSAHYPEHTNGYSILYRGDRLGRAVPEYYASIDQIMQPILQHYRIPQRMPRRLWWDFLDENDRVVVTLDFIDHYLKAGGHTSPYGFAAYSISQLKEPLSSMRRQLRQIKGVGEAIERVVLEILDTGRSGLLQRLAGSGPLRPVV